MNTQGDQNSKNVKRRKVPGASKKDIATALQALLDGENGTSLFDIVKSIDPDILTKTVHQILNNNLDYDSLSPKGPKRSIDQFLAETNIVVRFAPAPSGELHIGHVVPILLNTILAQICRNYGKRATMVIRIDDTDPDVLNDRATACAGVDILKTVKQFLRVDSFADAGIICYNSSDHIDQIVKMVLDSIRSGDDYFYPDPTPQVDIQSQRSKKEGSAYRDIDLTDRIQLLDRMINCSDSQLDGVIRAKIDPKSDNGNLRDPVMIRIWNENGRIRFYPTYDLVCPVLDLYDSRRFDMGDGAHTLLAMRDCNYYDRFDQYLWIQNALASHNFVTQGGAPVTPTSMLTFSRVQLQNVVLSKRKIRALTESGVVDGWDDPRIFTIPGVQKRGITLAGLANFYWLLRTISTANRDSEITLVNFFAAYDKVLSRTVTPIVNRIQDGAPIPPDCDSIYDATIVSYRDVTFDNPDSAKPRVVGTFKIDLDQIMVANLMHYQNVDIDPNHLNTPGVSVKPIYDKLKAGKFSDLFYHGTDLRVGQIVKINNFKDDSDQAVYGGFYLIRSIDHDKKQIVFSSISN